MIVRFTTYGIFLQCLFLSILFAGVSNAQNIKSVNDVYLDLNLKDASIVDAFKTIEKKTDFQFTYDRANINNDILINYTSKRTTVGDVLMEISKEANLKFRQVNNHINVNKKQKTEKATIEVLIQGISITGRVTDSDGEAIPGVNIIVKGTSTGTVTDVEGNYQMEVPDENSIIILSAVGFVTEEITVGNRVVIDLVLTPDLTQLEEIVVIGYGEQRKSEVTGAVAGVKSDQFIQGNVGDAAQLIQGKVAGLIVATPSGDPTANSQILLRGTSTLSTSTQPLILIDGIPGNINTLAQDDIESIDVLKDGSAAAIYGTRGTNGVILITSKQGRNIEPTLSYNAYVSTEQWVNVPRMYNAEEFRDRIAEGIAFSDEGSSTDWVDEISNKNPITQYHNFSLTGGSSNTNYMASLNYKQSPGMVKNYDYKTVNGRMDVNHNMFDNKLKFNVNLIINKNKRKVDFDQIGQSQDNPDDIFHQALWRNPTAPLKNDDGTWNENVSISYYHNPVAVLMETYGSNESLSTRLSGTVAYEPTDEWRFKALYSFSNDNDQASQGNTKQHLSTVKDGFNGYASKSAGQSTSNLLELTADWRKTINDAHTIQALAGYSYQDNIWEWQFMRNWDFPAGNFSYPDNIGAGQKFGNGGPDLMSSAKYASNLIGFFGRVNYNFKDKYLFMASLRYEGSSKFIGTDEPWGTFPAVSVGWRMHEEGFLKGSSFINRLKLRAGYGVTGTAPDEHFLGVATLGYSGASLINGSWVPSLTPNRNPNPKLRWEEKKETNIGLDFAILDSRISGSIDFYNRTTDGLLYDYSVPTPPNLYGTTKANVGVMENKGVEILIDFVPVQAKKVVWNSTVIFSTNTNKLKSLSNQIYKTTNDWFDVGYAGTQIQSSTHRVQVGEPIGNFRGYKVIDIDDDGYWIYEDKDGNPAGTPDVGEDDRQLLGNGLPKYYANWNNTVTVGNFDFTVTMRGAFGFQILNRNRMYFENPGSTTYNQMLSANDKIFGKATLNVNEPPELNSYYIEDGDYWKIDNLMLGYSFPMLNVKHIRKARIYISTLNTFTFTNYSGMDPEVQRLGLEPGNDPRYKYPKTRVYSLGVHLTIN